MVSLPLLFQMIFFVMLFAQVRQLEVENAREVRARRIMQTINKLSELTYEIIAGAVQLKGFLASGNQQKLDQFAEILDVSGQKADKYRADLRALVSGHPDELEAFENLDKFYGKTSRVARLVHEGLTESPGSLSMIENVSEYKDLKKEVLSTLGESVKDFLHRYEKIEKGSPEAQRRLRDSQKGIIIFGIAGNIIIAFLLVMYFSRSITNRLKIMTANTSLLQKRQALLPRISGSDEIAQLDAVFHSMADELDAAGREKKEFLELVSHDIRSPMTAILGNIVLLNLGKMGEISEEAKVRMASAEENSRKLITVINDLLDFEKLESGQLSFVIKAQRVEQLVDAVFQKLEPLAEKIGVELEMDIKDEDLSVLADGARLSQVLENLLNNAIVFCGEKKMVFVAAAKQGTQAEITITDKSRKVPPDIIEHAFDRRGASLAKDIRQYFGKGLALPLSKLIIESMDGKIGVREADSSGISFWIRLNLAE